MTRAERRGAHQSLLRVALRGLRQWTPSAWQRGRKSLVHASVWKAPRLADDVQCDTSMEPVASTALDPARAPILGEFAWHSLTADARLVETSEAHYRLVAGLLEDAGTKSASRLRLTVSSSSRAMVCRRCGPAHCGMGKIS